MSDPRVGQYLGEHFIATYHQIGDFEVVNVNGKLQKNGGNVASYFCTPDGRVIHVTAKPISAEQLLKQATWAVETYQEVSTAAPGNLRAQWKLVEQAHLGRLQGNILEFESQVKAEMPRAQKDYHDKIRAQYEHPGKKRPPEPALVIARRRAAQRLGGDRAHQIMAAQPLAPFREIYREVFEKLTNERVIENRGTVYAAAEGLRRAQENGLPILLVIYDGHGEDKDEWDSKTKELVKDVFYTPQVAPALRHYITIFIPKRQLAALSNLADLPVYALTEKSSPLLITTDSLGEQMGTSYGSISPENLAMLLWPAIHEARIGYAEKLAAEGKHTPALKILQQVHMTTKSFVVNQRAMQLTNQVKFQVGEKWAADGRYRSALRIFTTVSTSTGDEELRLRSLALIAQLRSTHVLAQATSP